MEHVALNMDIKTDIVIIGAGPAGSMAANVLRGCSENGQDLENQVFWE